jgi:hypothetical protein
MSSPCICHFLLAVDCGAAAKPLNSVFVSENKKSFTIRCEEGYKFEGGQETITETCQNNGQWTSKSPLCKEGIVFFSFNIFIYATIIYMI